MKTFRILHNKKGMKIPKRKNPTGLLSFEIIDRNDMAEANKYACDTYGKGLIGITDITDIKHLYISN